MGLTAEEIERLNQRARNSSLISTLEAVSISSEVPRVGVSNHLVNKRETKSVSIMLYWGVLVE